MPRILYGTGRFLQLVGLLAMPSAIWAGEIQRSEARAIIIFSVSGLLFLIGYLIVRFSGGRN